MLLQHFRCRRNEFFCYCVRLFLRHNKYYFIGGILIDPLLPKEQAGFRRGKSTVDQVVLLTQNIEDSFEAKKKAGAVFIDLTAAYDNFARLGIRASEWTNHKWKTEYCENASRLRGFVPETGARPVGMGLPRAVWVKLNRLRTGVGRFHSSMHKWGLAPSSNCEGGASEQTADHVLTVCPIHRAPHGARGLTVLDDETRCWLNDITASI